MTWCATVYGWPPDVTLRQELRHLVVLNKDWVRAEKARARASAATARKRR